MKPALRAANTLLATAALVAATMVGLASGAQASPQVYNPCGWLSLGQVKFSAYGANRVTFATSTDRSSDVVTITGCVRSGSGYVQEWQDWGYIGLNGFAAGSTWEDSYRSPSGSFSMTEALGRSNPGTALAYHTLNPNSRWGGERGATYNQYFEGAGGESDENLWYYMNLGYYEQAAVINYNRYPDMPTVQGASFAIFFHAGRVPSAGCVSTSLSTVTRLLQTNRPGDRIIMGAVDDVFTPYISDPFGAITNKYGSTGGTFGPLGNPTSNETGGLAEGGSYQFFNGGAIYWSPGTGPHTIGGGILSAWRSTGAEGGYLGYPTTDEIGGLKDGGTYQMYQNGAIIWSPATGARISNGAIRNAWASTGYENGYLGYPTTDEIRGLKDGGTYQMYQNGAIIWSPATGAHISNGAVRSAWAGTGYENGYLGYPTTDEIRGLKDGGTYQMYQGGAIIWSPATGAHVSNGAVRNVWLGAGGENGYLGYPTTDEIRGLKDGGTYQMYQGGAIVWSPATGARISNGAVRNAWAATGYENGPLGYPTSNEQPVSSRTVQDYQGGFIGWTPQNGAFTVTGAIADSLHANRGMGAPVGPEVKTADGAYQMFTNGAIIWTPATGAHVSTGAIRSVWAGTGYEGGPLGYPTTDEFAASGGWYQTYQGGSIFWSPATGGRVVATDFAAKLTSGALATLGYPTANAVTNLTGGGSSQAFQNGILVESPATGVHPLTGAILKAWTGAGAQDGALGYATSDPYAGANGSTVQDFEHGSILVATDGTVTVTRQQDASAAAPAPSTAAPATTAAAPTAAAAPVTTEATAAPAGPTPAATPTPTATAPTASPATAAAAAAPTPTADPAVTAATTSGW
ncbi:hypothetical protein [Sinomonas sp. B1-1]|uniref:hypothetical protein n=1 Tax=Sinomonas sp. B1-1 TaxID=3141454 RepID=UPI003D2B7BD3